MVIYIKKNTILLKNLHSRKIAPHVAFKIKDSSDLAYPRMSL